jgi:dTDP-4-amino-4,6-dideoxygalactose transaminase
MSRKNQKVRVPFLDLGAHHRKFAAAFRRKFNEVLRSSEFILGRELEAFEAEFAAYIGVGHAIGVSNGTDALRLACEAIDLRPGDEVIVPATTYIASALGVSFAGGTPRFAEVTADTFSLDPARLEDAITPHTRAVMPVHLFGHPADIDPIREIARRRGLRVIEDAAQAHGALYKGRRAGSLGDLGCFSFYPSKNLGALGDGGMVTTDDAALAGRLRMLRNLGQKRRYYHDVLGNNNRLDNLQAAFLRLKLKKLEQHNRLRQAAAARYNKALAGSGAVLPVARPGSTHVFHIYNILHPERDELRRRLEAARISCGVYYPMPAPYQECYRSLGYKRGDFPVSERLAAQSLALPMFPEITPAQIRAVAAALRT